MSKSYISVDLRRLVTERADNLCEYCLLHEEDAFFSYEVDHIISEKHGGATRADNLAFTCFFCNRAKGSDIGSIIWSSGEFIRFFNPRLDKWSDHFALSGAVIVSLTNIGEATMNILDFNNEDRQRERELLLSINRYPTPSALRRIAGAADSENTNQDI